VHLLTERQMPAPWRLGQWVQLTKDTGLLWGLPLLLALTLPWFLWAQVETNGAFFRSFFWEHNVERALGGTDGMRARPWYTYGVYLASHFLPWSIVLPGAFWVLCRNRGDAEARFSAIWLTTIVVVLSVAGFKRADYLLPAFPGAALLIGFAAEHVLQSSEYRRKIMVGVVGFVAISVVGWFVYLQWLLPRQEPSREFQRFAKEIRRRVPAPDLVLLFRVEAHALAFHLGPELDTFLEWENLDTWAGRPGQHYIVMPAECAAQWAQFVRAGTLEEVMRSTDFTGAHERRRPLVLMQTRPRPH
jgi:4-amino-4-deoxy-L-arabinose transferase-like glycosyltransferase